MKDNELAMDYEYLIRATHGNIVGSNADNYRAFVTYSRMEGKSDPLSLSRTTETVVGSLKKAIEKVMRHYDKRLTAEQLETFKGSIELLTKQPTLEIVDLVIKLSCITFMKLNITLEDPISDSLN